MFGKTTAKKHRTTAVLLRLNLEEKEFKWGKVCHSPKYTMDQETQCNENYGVVITFVIFVYHTRSYGWQEPQAPVNLDEKCFLMCSRDPC